MPWRVMDGARHVPLKHKPYRAPFRSMTRQLLAAVDLGSNSFRMLIGRVEEDAAGVRIFPVERMKETVRLAAGLSAQKMLDDAAVARAIDVLKRFSERLRSFRPDEVRAVATNTFRVAKNVAAFLPLAEEALGFPIEVIAGREEARLIFSGVAHSLPPSAENRLVIDIGGGSTEFIVGQGFEPKLMESLYLGCVSYSRQYFPNGVIEAHAMKQAELAARKEIEVIAKPYRKAGWAEAFGSSGTAKALNGILTASGFSEHGITRGGMKKLRDTLIRNERVDRANLQGIKPDRHAVLPGGLAIMLAAFEELGIERIDVADGALRLGVLYDLVGREAAHDKRADTVAQFKRRYEVDVAQAQRVAAMALRWHTDIAGGRTVHERMLEPYLAWAADLHEIGLSISHNSYHRHSAYICDNADMPGFSKQEQKIVAALVLGHTGKLPKVGEMLRDPDLWQPLLALRLAALAARRREDGEAPPLTVSARGQSIAVEAPRDWLDAHPLTEFALQQEAAEWRKVGFEFQLIQS
jgi:exopolyphosphatase/guanosine-5'-triphosphate,3'-diphosphate pyrophosphatase